uniref:Uncharacterized protein n=1 Tax=Centropages tenuiremis TaxID=544689 RepID=A0A0U2IGI5_9MAXI|nr:hypothetical protein [Centropages tenuiremis]
MSFTSRHNINNPKPWSRPRMKVYDLNRMSGEFYYKPMLEYIDGKDITGFKPELPVHLATLLSREPVKLPDPMERSQGNVDDLHSGAPRMLDFLTQYRAKQIREGNKQTVHTKNEIARQSRNVNTIHDTRTSTLIRNQYIREVSAIYKARRLE